MEVQHYQISLIDVEVRKHSQNTCHSSNDNSPNLEENVNHDSATKYLKAFSTGVSSPDSHVTPEKVFCTTSMDNFSSLQKRATSHDTHSKIPIAQKEIHQDKSQNTKMDEEASTKRIVSLETEEKKQLAGQQQTGITNIQANNKSLQVARIASNQTVNIKVQKTQQKTLLKTEQTKNSSKEESKSKPEAQKIAKTQTKPFRPLPSYKEARPALYVWTRTLCFQMNMCFDVFGLTLKYLDEYHTTYGNSYDRSTFTATAYGMIILASKVMNKRILTPKMIASKTTFKRQHLQQIQMKLINTMRYKVYFETFIKLLQRKIEKWENVCIKKGLREFCLFDENLESFKRFSLIIREVQTMVRQGKDIDDEDLMVCFVRVLTSQFRLLGKQETLCELLCETFEDDEEEATEFNKLHECKLMINNAPEMDFNDFDLCDRISKNFDRRNNKELYPVYSIFLNSIFDIKF